MPTDVREAVRNMSFIDHTSFIDDTYRAAGLPLRGDAAVLKRRSQ